MSLGQWEEQGGQTIVWNVDPTSSLSQAQSWGGGIWLRLSLDYWAKGPFGRALPSG